MSRLTTLLLIWCSCICSLTASPVETAEANYTATETVLARSAAAVPRERCSGDSSSRLTFVTTVSVRGCPLFVHRLGGLKLGKFVLEPTFCITSPGALRRPSAHYDLLTKESYFSFPVNVTDESLVAEAKLQLRHLDPKSVAFLEVTSVLLSANKSSFAFKDVAFLWGPTEGVGHLRVVCNRFACPSLALYISRGQTEAFESLSLVATLQAGDGCPLIEQTYPITIAQAPFIPVNSLQRPRDPKLRACTDLELFKVVQLKNCSAFVHKSQGKKGHFVIEPLLCPSGNFSLLTDYSLGRHYLKLPATVEDAAVMDAVSSRLASDSPQLIEFMRLWDAEIHVTGSLAQWKIEPLRLSADRRSAELRVYCKDLAACDLLGSVIISEPINFWKEVQWTATSVLADECEFRSTQPRFAFRMLETAPSGMALQAGGRWSMEALHRRTVTRNGRAYIVVQQRGCKTSNFQRSWAEYVQGFGDDDNFWIGLDIFHSLTNPQAPTLRVEMLLWNETEWFAEYTGFTVGPASTKYRMSYTTMVAARSSLVSDALAYSKGYPFSTRDSDNDAHSSPGYCSVNWGGSAGWWYRDCANANPNGIYNLGETSNSAYAGWDFREGRKALKEFRMLIQI